MPDTLSPPWLAVGIGLVSGHSAWSGDIKRGSVSHLDVPILPDRSRQMDGHLSKWIRLLFLITMGLIAAGQMVEDPPHGEARRRGCWIVSITSRLTSFLFIQPSEPRCSSRTGRTSNEQRGVGGKVLENELSRATKSAPRLLQIRRIGRWDRHKARRIE